MKRNRKLFRNTILIVILLFAFYYFGGFYFSKDQCVLETVRGLYGTETEKITEWENGNRTITLMADTEEKTFSLVGTKKIGFLYQTASSSIGYEIKEDQAITVSGMYNRDSGMAVAVYRNDKSVAKVEISFDTRDDVVLDDWHSDFVAFFEDTDGWYSGTYRAYNAAGELIDEVPY